MLGTRVFVEECFQGTRQLVEVSYQVCCVNSSATFSSEQFAPNLIVHIFATASYLRELILGHSTVRFVVWYSIVPDGQGLLHRRRRM